MPPSLEIISSSANPLVKTLRSLDRKKARQETGLFLAEGARLVEQGLQAGWTLDSLVISASSIDRGFIQALAAKAHKAGTVTGLTAEVGATVTNGQVICELKD